MRKIVQLSDLHFGRTDPKIVAGLQAFILSLGPDVVVVSGDLTQRATESQFLEARIFLNSLPFPKIVVPGNHDVPLYNIRRRFWRPFSRFRRLIHPTTEPHYADSEVAIIGLNTARALVFKGGRVNRAQLKNLESTLSALSEQVIKIVVTHHPLQLIRSYRTSFIGYSEKALRVLVKGRVDLLLAGHLHVSQIGSVVRPVKGQDHSAVQIQAGTATSLRYRGEPNAFNVLTIDGPRVIAEQYTWNKGTGNFALSQTEAFQREGGGWTIAKAQ
jgi:3',5'-cyclic AMP phosphodiesterase CpdA